jgi:hypothetical protein
MATSEQDMAYGTAYSMYQDALTTAAQNLDSKKFSPEPIK